MRVDHLILGAASLEAGLLEFERKTGVRAVVGGSHARWGTHNALAALGGERYLEILAPDPSVASPPEPRPFGLENRTGLQLVTWVASGNDLDACIDRGRAAGVDLGAISTGSRRRRDGVELRWRMTDLTRPREGGVIPFLIDWGDSPHPALALPPSCTLVELSAEHPEPERVSRLLGAMGLHLAVAPSPVPALIAKLETPRGIVLFR